MDDGKLITCISYVGGLTHEEYVHWIAYYQIEADEKQRAEAAKASRR
jgi:hypothetical protein